MEAPYGFDELRAAGLTMRVSRVIKTPHIEQSPVSFESVNHATMLTGPRQYMVIGRVVDIFIEDSFIKDKDNYYIDTQELDLVGRVQGTGGYIRCQDRFELRRISYEEWKNHNEN
ncbi:hypothetical protein MEG_01520 [Bartonella tamiae Th307]|uniref:Uncharacterized protein n=2 Tax=Bartonella tamiae TaxID=373638 RepID=J0R5R0_9HYPH|nr:hypothetical protein ME5_00361 [Bartonella tamiae Th239]EJF93306.1 hypothetical protein MEG_01520 [Bartonella tamiae Th307]